MYIIQLTMYNIVYNNVRRAQLGLELRKRYGEGNTSIFENEGIELHSVLL